LLLHGSANLYARVGLETLVGGGNWFTQSLRAGTLRSYAYGQVEKNHQRARINWLLVLDPSNDSSYLRIIDNLAFEAGLHGAKFLLAGVEKDSELFPLLRRAGFCVYGWERFWRMKPLPLKLAADKVGVWEKPSAEDVHEYHKFRNKQLPPAVRAIASADGRSLPDYVLRIDRVIAGYADVKVFGKKAVLYPVLTNDLKYPKTTLLSLAMRLPEVIQDRYISQTVGQEGLEGALENIAEAAVVRREQMVKYFSVVEKAPLGVLNHSSENSHPDPVAPYVHSSKL
jgi:hypothetical protein